MSFFVQGRPTAGPTRPQTGPEPVPSFQRATAAPSARAPNPAVFAAQHRLSGPGPVNPSQGVQLARHGIDRSGSTQLSEHASELLSSPALEREFAPVGAEQLIQARQQLRPVADHAVLRLGDDQTVDESARSIRLRADGSVFDRDRLPGPTGSLEIVAHGSPDGSTLGGKSPQELAKTLHDAGIRQLGLLDLKSCHSEAYCSELQQALQEVGITVGEVRGHRGEIAISRETGKVLSGAQLEGVGHDGTLGRDNDKIAQRRANFKKGIDPVQTRQKRMEREVQSRRTQREEAREDNRRAMREDLVLINDFSNRFGAAFDKIEDGKYVSILPMARELIRERLIGLAQLPTSRQNLTPEQQVDLERMIDHLEEHFSFCFEEILTKPKAYPSQIRKSICEILDDPVIVCRKHHAEFELGKGSRLTMYAPQEIARTYDWVRTDRGSQPGLASLGGLAVHHNADGTMALNGHRPSFSSAHVQYPALKGRPIDAKRHITAWHSLHEGMNRMLAAGRGDQMVGLANDTLTALCKNRTQSGMRRDLYRMLVANTYRGQVEKMREFDKLPVEKQELAIDQVLSHFIENGTPERKLPILMFILNSNPNNLWPGEGRDNSNINSVFEGIQGHLETVLQAGGTFADFKARLGGENSPRYNRAVEEIKNCLLDGDVMNHERCQTVLTRIAYLDVDAPDPGRMGHEQRRKLDNPVRQEALGRAVKQGHLLFEQLYFNQHPNPDVIGDVFRRLSAWVTEQPG